MSGSNHPKKKATFMSKSRYTKYCQCPKALWLSVYKPNEAIIDASVEVRFADGNAVGDLAMGLFGDFVEVTTHTASGRLDLSAMIQKTKEEMTRGTEVICEASFSYNNGKQSNYCAVDILRREGDGWAIYEVKSTTSHVADASLTDKKFVEKVMKYATDIAFQKWVLENCGVTITSTYLVTLNSDYVRKGDIDIQQLFNIIDIKNLVANEYAKVENISCDAHAILEQTSEVNKKIGMHCTNPYECAFWKYCTKQAGLDLENDKATVFNLYRMNANNKFEYFDKGIVSFNDVCNENLNIKQRTQVDCTLNNTDYINKEGIKEFLNKITYPLYFLDFESMQQTLPQWDGTRPYMQICFQYSLHYIEHEGGELKHKAFLAPSDGTDPRRALAEALCQDIPQDTCVMAYNDPFEKTRIKEMAEVYPDLATHLNNIRENIIDLLIPFREVHCYTPAMGGSFSIKSVLPALFPNDDELNYHNLCNLVQNGGDAMTIFPQIKNMPADDAEKARQALLNYCHLDTLAMVRVWEKLKELAVKK